MPTRGPCWQYCPTRGHQYHSLPPNRVQHYSLFKFCEVLVVSCKGHPVVGVLCEEFKERMYCDAVCHQRDARGQPGKRLQRRTALCIHLHARHTRDRATTRSSHEQQTAQGAREEQPSGRRKRQKKTKEKLKLLPSQSTAGSHLA